MSEAEKTREVTVDGRRVRISRPEKVLFPEKGTTKLDLASYYADVSEEMQSWMEDRPLVLQRYPDGVDEDGFFQKNIPDHFPDWIRSKELSKEGGATDYVLGGHKAVPVYLADQGTVAIHTWLSRADQPEKPDVVVWDIDPPESDSSPTMVRRAARTLCDILQKQGLSPGVQATGSKGFHVLLPVRRSVVFDKARSFARSVAEKAARDKPRLFTLEQRKDKRGGRCYLDTQRNAWGQTIIAPYSVRALPKATVATPLDLKELNERPVQPDRFDINSIPRRLGQKKNPWSNLFQNLNRIEKEIRES